MSVFSSLCRLMLSGGLVILACGQAAAHFRMVELTPMNRLLRSAEAYLAKHPDNPEAHYTVARIHYLTFHLRSTRIPAGRYDEKANELPYVVPRWMTDAAAPETKSAALSDTELVEHARISIDEFCSTLKLDANNAMAQLGIASLEEEFLIWNTHKKIKQLPSELVGITPAVLRSEYAKAMLLAMPDDSKLRMLPVTHLAGIISYEAASALVRIDKNGDDALTSQERDNLKQAEAAVEHFGSLKRGAVTPIVFSFQPASHLDALLAPDTLVAFDLRGFGPRERWPWVKPELGLLVWDPARTGRIYSARQLFGGYSFQIFRDNGYDALAALDDNEDGVLSGDELNGICVWFDRNSDGIATPGEVIPVRDLGIVSIAVTNDGHDGIYLTNARGITLHDGRTLRTWDWITAPASQTTVAAGR